MKRIFILLCICFITTKAQSQNIIKITLQTLPFNLETIIAISSEVFENHFKDEKKTYEINKSDFKKVQELLSKSKSKSLTDIDVRGELLIVFDNNLIKKIFFDRFGQFYDGTTSLLNKQLFDFILNQKLDKE